MIKKPFSFEHTFQFTENLYIAFNTNLARKTRLVRLLLVTTIGIASLFWAYTLLLGIFLLLLVTMFVFLPSRIPGALSNIFKKTAYLHDETTYGINEKGLWIKGPLLNAETKWKNVAVWDERAGWLMVSANSIPSAWFPIEKLREAGVYDDVMKLCKKYAVKFNSREASKKYFSNKKLQRISDKLGSH